MDINEVTPNYTYSPFDYRNCGYCKNRIKSMDPGVAVMWYNDKDCKLRKDVGIKDRIEFNCICSKFVPLNS